MGDSGMGAVVARWRHGDASIVGGADDAAHIVLSLSSGQSVEQRLKDETKQLTATVGSFCVLPPGEAVITHVKGLADALHIFVPLRMMEAVHGRAPPNIAPSCYSTDPDIRRDCLEILVALRRSRSDRRLQERIFHLAQVLVKQSAIPPPTRGSAGLAPAAKRRVTELIDARINSDIAVRLTLGDMAEAARLSADHFARMFRQDTGTTPYLYISRRRLERAMTLLTTPAASVGEVADRTGFCSPSHFVSSFRRHLGVTPASFREAILP
jgi:AraC family transcriptional regulator